VIVDHQTHWYPPAYFEAVRGRHAPPRAERVAGGWRYEPWEGVEHRLAEAHVSLDAHLESMDAHGVSAMVSSPGLLGDVAHLEAPLAVELTEVLNGAAADAQRALRGRFLGAAMVPLQTPELAVASLERAWADGLRALCVLANADGRSIATADLLPLYRRAGELGVTLYLHPSERSTAFASTPHRAVEVGVNWLWDTSVAALSLVYSGILEQAPGLTVVQPHLGGVVPFLIGRLAGVEQLEPASGARRPVAEVLRDRFYVDSLNPTPGALALAVRLYGVDRILFASDAPFVDRGAALDLVRRELSDEDADRVLRRNALPGREPGSDPGLTPG
jgi:predicted TIM-barrel fold metal-dependent hydrolase